MIHSEELSVCMTRGNVCGPYVAMDSPDRPRIYVNVSRAHWGTVEIGDKARVWFLFNQPVWVQWYKKP